MEITILHDYVTSHEKEWLEQGKIEGKLDGKEEEKLKEESDKLTEWPEIL